MFKHILIPTDGSPLSNEAAAAGVQLAKALGARITGFFAAPAAPVTPSSISPRTGLADSVRPGHYSGGAGFRIDRSHERSPAHAEERGRSGSGLCRLSL